MANHMETMQHSAKPPSSPSKGDGAARQSPLVPLAPLEFLQTQRRGSITDPSLHAASTKGNVNSSLNRTLGEMRGMTKSPKDLRPKSPFVFGDATVREGSLRKLLRSPSLEADRPLSASGPKKNERQEMDVDSRGFDYSMRRHSIAVGLDSPTRLLGLKRKMSGDKIHLQERMDVDLAPAPKRRGSAVDTARIASLTLNDRRNSVDSRGPPPPPLLWKGHRSSSSSVGPRDRPAETRPMFDFAWPNSSSSDHEDMNRHPLSHDQRYDPMAGVGIMPPMPFAADSDRRMSMPDSLDGPNRSLRSRSRPPSRQMTAGDAQDDSGSAPSPPSSSKLPKDSSSTPYSRSPELRVSHKLAERKRRKEMKELFDELRDQLPADRGMKASKWEILSKAIDFVSQLKQTHQDMAHEIDVLRHELDIARQASGMPPFAPPGGPQHPGVVYAQPPPGVSPYPLPPPPGMQQQSHSRPPSSQGAYPSGGPIDTQPQNGNLNRSDIPPT